MFTIVIDFVMDLVWDLLNSFYGGRFHGEEWAGKLGLRLLLGFGTFAFAVLLVVGLTKNLLFLTVMGAAGLIFHFILYIRFDHIWNKFQLWRSVGKIKQQLPKI